MEHSLTLHIPTSKDLRAKFQTDVKKIFYQTAAKNIDRDKLFSDWLAPYLNHYGDNFVLALNRQEQVVGYLNFCLNSSQYLEHHALGANQRSMLLFRDLFNDFPIHCHMNVDPNFQGHGIGRKLIKCFLAQVDSQKYAGWHIITSADASNRYFYQKTGLTIEHHRDSGWASLLLMGQKLSDIVGES